MGGDGIAGLSPRGIFFEAHFQVEEAFLIGSGLIGVRNIYEQSVAGFEGWHIERAFFHLMAIGEHGVVHLVEVEVGEVVHVLNAGFLCRGIEIAEAHALVHLFNLRELGRPSAVGTHEAVVHEVALRRAGEVVAGLVARETVGGEVAVFDVIGTIDRLVHPVPDAAAHTVGAALDDVPVFFEVAHGVAHSVGILAHEIRLLAPVVVGLRRGEVDVGIHHAPHIRIIGIAARCSFVVHGAVVEFVRTVVAGFQVAADARLVAERPEADGGVVAVAQHHALNAVHVGRLPGGGVGKTEIVFPVLVAFEVGLVHAIEAVVVEHGVHLCLAGVVAGAHGVHVGLFHHDNVFEHGGHVDGTAVHGVRVLEVRATEEYALAVDGHLVVLNLHGAEAVFCGKCHFFFAVGGELRHFHGVEVGRFGRPGQEVGKRKGEVLRERAGGGGKGKVLSLRCHRFATGREQAHLDFLGGGESVAVVHFDIHVHRAAIISRVERGGDVVVAHEGLGRGVEIDVAVNAAHVEHVLPFDVRAVAPAEHLNAHIVLARAGCGGDVELSIVVAALRVAHVSAVHPYEGCAVNAVEVEEEALAVPAGGQVESAAVRAYGVVQPRLHLNVGRVVGKGIFYIYI